jgi:hypothetical protein
MRRACLVFAVLGLAGSLWAADPIIGTWKLNIGKSKSSQLAASSIKEQIEVYRELDSGRIEYSSTRIGQDGSRSLFKSIFPKQGGIAEVLQGGTEGISYVNTLIEPGNWYLSVMMNGGQVGIIHKTFNKDGKVMRQTLKGVDAQGKYVEGESLFDRQ